MCTELAGTRYRLVSQRFRMAQSLTDMTPWAPSAGGSFRTWIGSARGPAVPSLPVTPRITLSPAAATVIPPFCSPPPLPGALLVLQPPLPSALSGRALLASSCAAPLAEPAEFGWLLSSDSCCSGRAPAAEAELLWLLTLFAALLGQGFIAIECLAASSAVMACTSCNIIRLQ